MGRSERFSTLVSLEVGLIELERAQKEEGRNPIAPVELLKEHLKEEWKKELLHPGEEDGSGAVYDDDEEVVEEVGAASPVLAIPFIPRKKVGGVWPKRIRNFLFVLFLLGVGGMLTAYILKWVFISKIAGAG